MVVIMTEMIMVGDKKEIGGYGVQKYEEDMKIPVHDSKRCLTQTVKEVEMESSLPYCSSRRRSLGAQFHEQNHSGAPH